MTDGLPLYLLIDFAKITRKKFKVNRKFDLYFISYFLGFNKPTFVASGLINLDKMSILKGQHNT